LLDSLLQEKEQTIQAIQEMAPTVIMKTHPISSSGGSKLVRLSTGNSMAKARGLTKRVRGDRRGNRGH